MLEMRKKRILIAFMIVSLLSCSCQLKEKRGTLPESTEINEKEESDLGMDDLSESKLWIAPWESETEKEEGGDYSTTRERYHTFREIEDNAARADFADDMAFEYLKSVYGQIDFYGEFKPGDENTYDFFIEKFQRLVKNQEPFLNPKTGEHYYLYELKSICFDMMKDRFACKTKYSYLFFDMDEDGTPELSITDNKRFHYIFKYASDTNQFLLLYEGDQFEHQIIGSRKVGCNWSIGGNTFFLLDKNGQEECVISFASKLLSRETNQEPELVYMLSLPFDESGQYKEVPDEILSQGYSKKLWIKSGDDEWNIERMYFRVTEEQYKELTEDFFEAEEAAKEQQKEVSHTYEELFGKQESYNCYVRGEQERYHTFQEIQYHLEKTGFVDDTAFEYLKSVYSQIDFWEEFNQGDKETFDYFKEKFWLLIRYQAPFLDKKTGERHYLYDLGFTGEKLWDKENDWCCYELFDIDEDGTPELCLKGGSSDQYIFKYALDTDEFILLLKIKSSSYQFHGGSKMSWGFDGGIATLENHAFYRLNERCEKECMVYFFEELIERHDNQELEHVYMVTLPIDRTGQYKEVPDKIAMQGYCEQYDREVLFFRVTKEQYEKLTDDFFEARENAQIRQREAGYSYKELFGGLEVTLTQVSHF